MFLSACLQKVCSKALSFTSALRSVISRCLFEEAICIQFAFRAVGISCLSLKVISSGAWSAGLGSQAGAAHKGPNVGERAATGGGDPAGERNAGSVGNLTGCFSGGASALG
jgi:hypothetical protein